MLKSFDYTVNRQSYAFASSQKDGRVLSNKLFFCKAHDEIGENLAMYVRAYTPNEAAKCVVDYWRSQEVIDEPDDIDEDVILVYRVPTINGGMGVLDWDDFDCVSVDKIELF